MSLHCRHVLSSVLALAWPGRALRRSVWALTAQQLVRSPVCTVLRCTAADLAVLAGAKCVHISNARTFDPGQNGQIGCCATQDHADWPSTGGKHARI